MQRAGDIDLQQELALLLCHSRRSDAFLDKRLQHSDLVQLACGSIMMSTLQPRQGRTQLRMLAAASPSRGGLSGLERRALVVFVGRRREFAAVKRARDSLHVLEQAA